MFWRKTKKQTAELSVDNPGDLRAVAITDLGAVRKNNEDRVLFVRPSDIEQRAKKGVLAMVADGMGGHAAGEIASSFAVEIISQEYFKSEEPPLAALATAFAKANDRIFREGSRDRAVKGMGTTCTVAAVINQTIHLAHIGDSRAYLITSDQIYQLTEDHTYVQELLNQGKIDPVEALNHAHKHVLTKALGTTNESRGDFFISRFKLAETDKLLLCTDGFYEYFTDEEIKDCVHQHELHEAGKLLLQQARARGGHDNISLLLVENIKEELKSELTTRTINI
jgi:protein phosphatase